MSSRWRMRVSAWLSTTSLRLRQAGRFAFPAAARRAESVRVFHEELAEAAGVAFVERLECLLELARAVTQGRRIRLERCAGDSAPGRRRYREEVSAVVTSATITCPECGTQSRAAMPTDACQFFWTCPACSARLRPLPGDCCVFCSDADQPCPPRQLRQSDTS